MFFFIIILFCVANSSIYAEQEKNNINFTIYQNGDLKSLLYFYTYPQNTTKLSVDNSVYHSAPQSLKYDLDINEYAGIGIGFTAMDFHNFKNKASLEFWIKGRDGEELIYFGFAASDTNEIKCINILPLDKYIKVFKKLAKSHYSVGKFF